MRSSSSTGAAVEREPEPFFWIDLSSPQMPRTPRADILASSRRAPAEPAEYDSSADAGLLEFHLFGPRSLRDDFEELVAREQFRGDAGGGRAPRSGARARLEAELEARRQ